MRHAFAVVLGLAMFSVVNASEPGQSFDCSDLVFGEPGLSCTALVTCAPGQGLPCNGPGTILTTDNLGRLLYWVNTPVFPTCFTDRTQWRQELRVRSGATETVLASVEDRCFGPGTNEEIFDPGGVHFDAVNGFVVVPMGSFCVGSCTYSSTHWVAAISGFAPLFEILTSYSPIGSVAFRVPSHPEGLQGTDHFDTYYGPLTASKDFSHAQPLRCNYPATIPQPGDYLEAGIVPDPPSRQGYYYVTAATYQGETRYGRKRENGVLSGRDPAGLPPCALATVGSVASLR